MCNTAIDILQEQLLISRYFNKKLTCEFIGSINWKRCELPTSTEAPWVNGVALYILWLSTEIDAARSRGIMTTAPLTYSTAQCCLQMSGPTNWTHQLWPIQYDCHSKLLNIVNYFKILNPQCVQDFHSPNPKITTVKNRIKHHSNYMVHWCYTNLRLPLPLYGI